MTKKFVRLSALLVLAMFSLIVTSKSLLAAPQNQPPDTVVDEPLVDWTIGGSMLYWGDRCPPGPDVAASGVQAGNDTFLLRRMPLNGGAKRTLDTSTDIDCSNYQHMVADDEAIYYFNPDDGLIEKVPVDNPGAGPVTVADVGGHGPTTNLMIKDGMLYYGTNLREIMRLPVEGGSPQSIVDTSHIPKDIEFLGDTMYWIDNDGVWFVQLPCNGCARVEYSKKGGSYLLTVSGNIASGNIYWVVPGNGSTTPSRIYVKTPDVIPVGADAQTPDSPSGDQVVHTAPLGYTIGDPVALQSLFGGAKLYWVESHFAEEDFVRRDGDIIGTVDGNLNHRLHIVNSDVYFARIDEGAQSILRIPKDAAALKRDMTIAAIEVTQAVQNLENGVPLIADKTTYVRVYGQQVSGALKGAAEAWLEGYRNGAPLPGSPLKALNGAQPLITGEPIDREDGRDAKGDWLFQLPGSWDDEGGLELRAIVDPRGAYEDTDPSNNMLSTTVAFDQEPDPCLVFYPVETHTPALPDHTDPIFWDTLDRLVSLWPVDNATVLWVGEPIRELELCWDWDGHCWGPYEMNQGWEITNFPPDSERVLAKLMLRQATSQIQALLYCEDSASVHTVGMVHGESETGTTGGYANFLINASWVKFDNTESNDSRKWNQPTAGAVLAQELTHNFWRYHIGCRDEEDSFFGLGDWPYEDRCKIDDRSLTEATTYYGFDPISHQIVRPDLAGDFMTYRTRRWVSDFTFKDVKSLVRSLLAGSEISAVEATGPSTPLEGESLLLSGVYDSISELGRFFYSYVLPNDMITDVATGGPPAELNADSVPQRGSQAEPDARIRLLKPNGELIAEHPIDMIAPDNHEGDYAAHYFLEQIPKPAETIGQVQLIVDGKLVHSVTPSANAPVVEILSPTVNDTLGQEITIRWRATDADNDVMLFSINYSRDGGVSWLPLVTEYPGDVGAGGVESDVTSLTLESPETLPGSDGNVARLRVIASDGFNTTVAEVGPFTVEDRPPLAIIQSPAAEAWFEPTQTILLRGLGYDAEGGLMADDGVEWSIDGEIIGGNRQRNLLGLAPGVHSVQLKVTDSADQTATTDGVVNVLPLSVDIATSLRMDGRCNDGAYVDASPLPIAGYSAGGNASAYLIRRGDDLWACLSGLARNEGVISEVGLYIDADNSRDAAAQADDYLFRLGEDGSPQVFTGTGAGLFDSPASIDFSAQVAATDTAWSAEFRIPAASLMLWNGSFGVAVSHKVDAETVLWPHSANGAAPNTWAEVAAEVVPYIDAISPGEVTVGDQGVTLVVQGMRFGEEASLLWDGVAQSAQISDTTTLTVPVSGALLQSAGVVELTVVNTTSSAYASNPVELVIYNKTPTITRLSPDSAELGAGATTVTITGQDFVNGSVAIWDGEPRSTRFVNATTLEMDLSAADLSEEQARGVTVLAPEPRRAVSNTLAFVVGNPGPSSESPDEKIFLPVIMR